MRIKNTSALFSVKLDEAAGVPKEIQYLRVGKFKHPQYGEFEITKQVLAEIKSNFDQNIRGVDMAIDYFHESDKIAAGWVREFILKEDNNELWIQVDWTPRGAQRLNERELRYFSPDFAFQWTDPEKGVAYRNVAFGGGLTNRPFVKEMKAIVADEIERGNTMTELEKAQARVKELETANLKLSEDYKAAEKKLEEMPAQGDKVKELEAKIAAMQQELVQAKQAAQLAEDEKKKAMGQYQEAQQKAQLAEKEKAFNILLSEGKAVAAQKEAFMSGNMDEFIKLAQPVNLNPNGKSITTDPTADENVQKVLKLAEEKRKANPKLSQGDAVSLAKKELKV